MAGGSEMGNFKYEVCFKPTMVKEPQNIDNGANKNNLNRRQLSRHVQVTTTNCHCVTLCSSKIWPDAARCRRGRFTTSSL